jgi:hypothetical protein
MPTEPDPITLAEVVRRAGEVCELGEVDEGVDALLERFEDADEPVSAVEDIESLMQDARGAIDPDEDDAALAMATAVAVYLAHRRDEIDADAATLLQLAARAEFAGEPPPAVHAWLEAAGVEA